MAVHRLNRVHSTSATAPAEAAKMIRALKDGPLREHILNSFAGEWAANPWRFWIADSPHVSRRRVTGNTLDPTMLR